jgi:hypothetical protein
MDKSTLTRLLWTEVTDAPKDIRGFYNVGSFIFSIGQKGVHITTNGIDWQALNNGLPDLGLTHFSALLGPVDMHQTIRKIVLKKQ